MAQKKGLVYRITMGKDDLPDFTDKRLPGSRWAVFKDVFFNRLGAMAKTSLLTLVFMLPAIAWLFIMTQVIRIDGIIVPYSGNLGIGYPVVTEAALIGQLRKFSYEIQMYLTLIPLFMLAGVGFAGAFNIMKRLGWGEGVSVSSPFFTGIKRNWLSFIGIFLFAGVSTFVLMFSISAYGYLTNVHQALRVLMVTLAVIQFIIMLCMMIFLCTQCVTYKLGFFALIKNSLLFAIALLPQNLFFIALSALPVIILMLLPLQISLFLWLVFAVLGVAYIVLIWTVYAHWVYDRFVNDHVKGATKNRGMYVKNEEDERKEEIERIKTRAAVYGAAYASRRLSSIDNGKTFTPLTENFSRNDLAKLREEKQEMREQIENEIADVNEQLEREQRAYEEAQEAAKHAKKKKNVKKQPKKKEHFDENEIGTLPGSDEEYKEDAE